MRTDASDLNRPDDMVEVARPSLAKASGGGGVWRIAQCRRKLVVRGELPGAHGYDRAAQLLRRIRASHQVATEELLALAFPTSWLVNNRTTSPIFKAWAEPDYVRHWRGLLEVLDGIDVYGWAALPGEQRERVRRHAGALCIEGQGVAALSKVLALLLPDLVPLMDDAALAFLLGPAGLPANPRAEAPTAGAECFVPMLDAFAAAVCAAEATLATLATFTRPRGLSPAQVLDRLLWMESWGWRLFGTGRGSWWWIGDGRAAHAHRQAILTLDAPPTQAARPEVCVHLDEIVDDAVRARVEAQLERVWPS